MNESTESKAPFDPTVAALPSRKSEIARLKIAQLSLESGLSLEDVLREICIVSSDYLDVARVGVWLMDEQRTLLKCIELFEKSGERAHGALLRVDEYPRYFEALRNRKVVSAEMAHHDPLTSELLDAYLLPLGITSILDAPIYVAGEVIGVLCSEHIGTAREWSTEERDLLASMADMLAGKIRAAEVHQLRSLLELSDDRLMKLEKSEALAKMANEIAHDFRNILSIIMNCAESLGLKGVDDSQMKELILSSTRRGIALAKELNDFGKDTPNRPVVIDVGTELKNALLLVQTALGAEYRVDLQLEQNLGKILMDRNEFQRVLINLILNSKQATPNGGTIDLRAMRWRANQDTRTHSVAIEIRDHGCGMSDDTKRRLFEPFFTTRPDGTGLGMPIVQRIVQRAGGDIEVESQEGVGTTLRIILPLVAH